VENIQSRFSQKVIAEAIELGEKDEEEAKREEANINTLTSFLESAKGLLTKRAQRERLGDKYNQALELLKEKLNHPNATVRRRVWMTVLSFRFAIPYDSQNEIEEMVVKLMDNKMLLPSPQGPINIFGETYNVAPEAKFEEEDIKEIRQMAKNCVENLRRAVRNTANLTLRGLLAGEPGRFSGYLPPEPYTDHEKGLSFRPGGILIVESKNGFVTPMDGSGKLEGGVQEMKRFEEKGNILRIPVSSLLEGIPFQVNPERLRPWKNLGGNETPVDLDDRFVKKTIYFWHLCKRMVRFAEWLEKINSLATVSPKKFFLDGTLGECLLDFGEPWKQSTDQPGEQMIIARPIVVVERLQKTVEVDGQPRPVDKKFLHLTEVPEYLSDWLRGCLGVYEEGERFEGVPYPLRAFLQAMYGRVARAAADTDHKMAALLLQTQ